METISIESNGSSEELERGEGCKQERQRGMYKYIERGGGFREKNN